MAEPLIVHLAASGHSGSTLLDMILGGHSQVSSLGEAYSIAYAERGNRTRSLCTCGARVLDCPFWRRVDAALAEMTGLPAGRALAGLEVAEVRPPGDAAGDAVGDAAGDAVGDAAGDAVGDAAGDAVGDASGAAPERAHGLLDRLHDATLVLGSRRLRDMAAWLSPEVRRQRRYARNLCLLYEAARRAQGTPIVVDSTKDTGTLKSVWMAAKEPLRVIVLTRDARAVCWSRMRREGVSMEVAARTWAGEEFRRRAVLLGVPGGRTIRLRYEDLCADPAGEVARLCAFLGLAFEPAMLRFREDRHNLGGNPMRLRAGDTEIRLDEDWKRELSRDDLATFARIAGRRNRRLGYGD